MLRDIIDRPYRPCAVLAVAVVVTGAILGPVTPFATPAAAQSLSPYGMWSDRDREFRTRREYRAERRYYAPQARDYDPRYDRRYDRRDVEDYYYNDDYEDDVPRRSARPQAPLDGKPVEIVREGGARPAIAPQAPPLVAFAGQGTPGSIIIDVRNRKLYYLVSATSAYAYPIGVGRDGFSWTGTETVSRVADWPDWHPPAEMRQRQPELPTKMLGGLRNPLGAKAIYLGNTLYRIHGTNDPKSIGRSESSGCFRMMNAHVVHLASLVQVGAQVSVVSALAVADAAAQNSRPQAAGGNGRVEARQPSRASWDDEAGQQVVPSEQREEPDDALDFYGSPDDRDNDDADGVIVR